MRSHAVSILLLVTACGGASPPAEEPAKAEPVASASPSEGAAPAAEQPAEDDSAKKKIPDACVGDSSSCTMPPAFVKRLCAGVHPDLALMFFAKGSPWRRAYVAVKEVSPFNGQGGPSAEEKLTFEEELIVLTEKKADTGGMQVSGAGSSYDCLRWDGTCATLSAEEVRLQAPSKPKHALIPWRSLADATQNALLENETVSKTVTERRKECKGATVGTVSAKCEKLDKKLNDVVFEAVRSGVVVPTPTKVP
jgi:hypothetical protein